MNEENQIIEEMAKAVFDGYIVSKRDEHFCEEVADYLYNLGYRKQSEGGVDFNGHIQKHFSVTSSRFSQGL